jgi:hypothetical protein
MYNRSRILVVPNNQFPGQPGNPVGYAAWPGNTLSGNSTVTPWPPTIGNGGVTSGPTWGSGTASNPTIVTNKLFDTGVQGSSFANFLVSLNGTSNASPANWVVFQGCWFQGNVLTGFNNLSALIDCASAGSTNIIFSYCSFTPRATFSAGPANTAWVTQAWPSPPAASWPSSSAASGLDDNTLGLGWMLPRNDSYQYAMFVGSASGGFITLDHCDAWGAADLIQPAMSSTAQINIVDCWLHDGRFGFGPVWDVTLTYPPGFFVSSSSPPTISNQFSANTTVTPGQANPASNANWSAGTNDHQDGILPNNGASNLSNMMIRHNTIASLGNTNAIAFQHNTGGLYQKISIVNNYLSGYNHPIDFNSSGSTPITAQDSNLVFTDNVVGTDLLFGSVLQRDLSPQFNNIAGCIWRRNKLKVYPGDTWSGLNANDGKFIWPDTTFNNTDWPN